MLDMIYPVSSMATSIKEGARDETILVKTGKSRGDWYAILDAFDCRSNGHKATAKFLEEVHGVGPWYAQTITVDYERARGIREIGQRDGGKFAVNVSRTISVPVERAWQAWADPAEMSAWFTTNATQDFREGGSYDNGDGDKGIYKKIVPNERLHFTWENENHCPGSMVIVEFISKNDKTTVAITHEKLPDKAGCEDMKKGWTWALTSLKSYLETGSPISYESWEKGKTELP
jgi:uncharacterized protein YndB with AHSA1/START domain